MKRSVAGGLAAVSLATCWLTPLSAAASDSVKLAVGGCACAEIVIATNAPVAARFAANELKWHLDRITGASFAVTEGERADYGGKLPIYVGETSATHELVTGLATQEFVVDVGTGAIRLVGVDAPRRNRDALRYNDCGQVSGRESAMPWPYERCGTTYAVYELLERQLGVRWLDASDYGTVLPSRPTLALPVGCVRKAPHFRFRGGTFASGANYSPWSAGANARPAEHAGYTNYQAFAYGGRSQSSINLQNRLYAIRHRAFGEKCEASHSFNEWYDRFWDKDNPKNRKFEKFRPELFAKVPFGKPGQLCYANPETIAQAVADVRAYFDGPPEKRRWGLDSCCLEPMDNCNFCPCELCAPQAEPSRRDENSEHSTYWFLFVNAVAREVKKTHPDARISTLAYMSHEGMPTGFRLEDNVIVHFCLFENRQPFRTTYPRQFARMLEWCKAYPDRRFAMWLYNCFPTEHYQSAGIMGVPGFFAAEAERQFDLFRRHDFSEGMFHCGMVGTIDSYLQFEWMVDPALRAEPMLDDFFAAYGKAARPLRDFYRLVESRYCTPSFRPKGMKCTSPECNWAKVCPKEVMDRLATLMAEAEAAVRDDEFARARVRLFRLENWEYMLAGVRQYEQFKDAPLPTWDSTRIPAAGGNLAQVPWDRLSAARHDLYFGGAREFTGLKSAMKFANDDTHLYLEVAMDVNSKALISNPGISYCDDMELYFAVGDGYDYRAYFSSPDGRIGAGDFGDGVWNRQPPEELAPAFGAACTSDTSRDGVWVSRYAFPLATLVAHPLRGGDVVRLNVVSVLNPRHVGNRRSKHAIVTATPYSGVHNTTRMGELRLSARTLPAACCRRADRGDAQ